MQTFFSLPCENFLSGEFCFLNKAELKHAVDGQLSSSSGANRTRTARARTHPFRHLRASVRDLGMRNCGSTEQVRYMIRIRNVIVPLKRTRFGKAEYFSSRLALRFFTFTYPVPRMINNAWQIQRQPSTLQFADIWIVRP